MNSVENVKKQKSSKHDTGGFKGLTLGPFG